MSLILASDEKIIREYEYASLGSVGVGKSSETYKKLIITNKRIVHQEHATGVGMERYSASEIPIEKAKYVDTYYGMKSYTILLVLGILFALAGLFALVAGEDFLVVTIFALILAVVFILVYIFKKDYVVIFTIKTDGFINSIMHASSRAGNSLTSGLRHGLRAADSALTINVKVRVHKEEAKALAEELGMAILEASRMDTFISAPESDPEEYKNY